MLDFVAANCPFAVLRRSYSSRKPAGKGDGEGGNIAGVVYGVSNIGGDHCGSKYTRRYEG